MYDDEILYWRRAYGSKPRDVLERMVSRDRRLDGRVIAAVRSATPSSAVRILDVGCGPISVLGWSHPAYAVELTGADPLADDYAHLLAEFGLVVPYPTYAIGAEELPAHIPPNTFDYVFSRNALDHAQDAPLAIANMISVTRSAGTIELEVFENEGVAAGYAGLHRWNFCQLDEQILVWNRSNARLLDDIVSPYSYTFEVLPKEDSSGRNRLIILIYKRQLETLICHSIENIVDIYYDIERRILQLCALKGDTTKKIFVHTHGTDRGGSKAVVSKTYSWPNNSDRLGIKLPPMEKIDIIVVGQYEYDHDQGGYVNFWQTELT
jgi:SAM-dependent methyltransferase